MGEEAHRPRNARQRKLKIRIQGATIFSCRPYKSSTEARRNLGRKSRDDGRRSAEAEERTAIIERPGFVIFSLAIFLQPLTSLGASRGSLDNCRRYRRAISMSSRGGGRGRGDEDNDRG